MKFGHSILTSELSGSVGGITASKARGGIGYFRVRATPGNPRTSAQSKARLILTSLAAAWKSTLTDTQRANWEALAPSGLSGIDAYVKVNANVLFTGQARVDDAPASIAFPATPLTAIAIDASANTIGFTNADANDDYYVNVFAQLTPQRSSQLAQKGHTTYVGTVHDDTAGAKTLSIAAFPGLAGAVAGDIVYLRLVQVDINGRVAQEQIERVTVVA